MYQARHAEQRVGTEYQRIDEVVVNPAVDHVDSPQSFRGPHVDEPVVDQQVPPLDELRANLVRQEDMLVEGGVVHPRSEEHDRWIGAPHRCQFLQSLQEHLTVLLDLLYPHGSVQAAKARLGGLPVSQHVRHARRHTEVVFKHLEAVVGAHQIGAADGYPRAMGGREAAHLDPVLRTAAHDVYRNHPVVYDAWHPEAVVAAGRAVHVLQEEVEGLEALGQPRFDLPPVGGGHHPGNAVDGNDPLVGLFVPVDREGYSLIRE